MLKVLLLYYFAVAVYLLINVVKGKKQLITRLLILLFCPFVSIALLAAMDKRVTNRNETPFQASMEEILKAKNQREIYVDEQQLDIVPVTDALLLSENSTKRKMLIKLLKDYSIDHLSILQSALENDDSETSHYAATGIQEMKRKLVNSLHSLEFQLEQNPDDLASLKAYSKALNDYIKSGFFDEKISKKYKYQYVSLLEKLIKLLPFEKEHYISKIEIELELQNYDRALQDAKLFLKKCPDQEESYFSLMNVYFILRDHESFQKVVEILRSSTVKLSPVGLEKLRFWLSEDES